MTQWYVKELSKLTQVSVQTLHHYDRISLLNPSVRLPNGYRLYSEKDLLKLQQIIALKFFGFELAQIKTLLAVEGDVLDHFFVQAQFLEEKAKTLREASQVLKKIVSGCSRNESIPWETIIKLIEVYHMTQQLEKTWAGKALSPDEVKEYANFAQELKTRFTESEKKVFEQDWADLVKQINANVDKDPTGEFGIYMAKRCMHWVNSLYGKKYASLAQAIWEKGFKGGHVNIEPMLPPKSVAWLDKAMYAYHANRVFSILDQLETTPSEEVLILWEDLVTEMCGGDQASKDKLYEAVLKDGRTTQKMKTWLKKVEKL